MSPFQVVFVIGLIKLKWALMWMFHYASHLSHVMYVINCMMKFG